MHVAPNPSSPPSVVLPPLAPGLAWGLTAQGWCPVPYDGPALAWSSSRAPLAPPPPPAIADPRAPAPVAAHDPWPPLEAWLVATANADPRFEIALRLWLTCLQGEAGARARLREALGRFGPLPTEPAERAAWIGRIAAQDDTTRAAMLEHADRTRMRESATALFHAAAAPHRATLPPLTTAPTCPSSPPRSPPPPPVEALATAAPLEAARPLSAAAIEAAPTSIAKAPVEPTAASSPSLAAPPIVAALRRVAMHEQHVQHAQRRCAEALAPHGAPPAGETWERWTQHLTAQDPTLAEALGAYVRAVAARAESLAALRAATGATSTPSTPSSSTTTPATSTSAGEPTAPSDSTPRPSAEPATRGEPEPSRERSAACSSTDAPKTEPSHEHDTRAETSHLDEWTDVQMRIRPDPHEPAPHRNGPLHATEIDAARALAERNPDVARLLDEHERHQSHAAQLAERFAEALARHGPTPTEPRERVAWIGALAEREPDIADAMRAGCAALEDADRSASQLAEALAARGRALLPWRPFTASC